MLLWPVLGGLSDEGRHGQKNQKKPFGCFKNFNCKYLGFLAEYKRWKCFYEVDYPIILKQSDFFYVKQLTRKLLQINQNKNKKIFQPR